MSKKRAHKHVNSPQPTSDSCSDQTRAYPNSCVLLQPRPLLISLYQPGTWHTIINQFREGKKKKVKGISAIRPVVIVFQLKRIPGAKYPVHLFHATHYLV